MENRSPGPISSRTNFPVTELLDIGFLKYPSSPVLECSKVIFEIFSPINFHKQRFENFYSASSRTNLIHLACATMELEH